MEAVVVVLIMIAISAIRAALSRGKTQQKPPAPPQHAQQAQQRQPPYQPSQPGARTYTPPSREEPSLFGFPLYPPKVSGSGSSGKWSVSLHEGPLARTAPPVAETPQPEAPTAVLDGRRRAALQAQTAYAKRGRDLVISQAVLNRRVPFSRIR